MALAGLVLSVVLTGLSVLPQIMTYVYMRNPSPVILEQLCIVNLHQTAQALTAYQQDYNEVLPPASQWASRLLPYVDGPVVLRCPVPSSGHSSYPGRAYGFNQALGGRSMSDIAAPSRVVALFDARGVGWNVSGGAPQLAPRHLDPSQGFGANVAFLDGREQWVMPEHAGALRWTPGPISEPHKPPHR